MGYLQKIKQNYKKLQPEYELNYALLHLNYTINKAIISHGKQNEYNNKEADFYQLDHLGIIFFSDII